MKTQAPDGIAAYQWGQESATPLRQLVRELVEAKEA